MATTVALVMAVSVVIELPLRGEFVDHSQANLLSEMGPKPSAVEIPIPWWRDAIETPLGISPRQTRITADEAMLLSLSQAPDIQVFAVQPEIERTEITRQQAAFDWNTFLESAWSDRSDPIGSTLVTGSVDGRFEDQLLSGGGGLRKSTTSGAEVELAERIGWQKNNSAFLIPNPQSTSRLELTLTQPLLAGRGDSYNLRRVFEARLFAEGTKAQSIANVQEYLLQVHQRYWELYRARAIFLQRKRAADRAGELAQSLYERTQLDATSRQLFRSRTAAAQQRAELMNAATAADLAAIELRRAIGMTDYDAELVPMQSPMTFEVSTDPSVAFQTALARRAEIDSAVRAVRIASVRFGASKNELLPRLDLIAGTYVAGLTPNQAVVDAFGRQFSDGRPSYNLGLAWERAAGNRASKSTLYRRQLEVQESMSRYESAVQDVRRDVEISIHQLHLSFRSLLQRHESLAASQAEAEYLLDRWNTSPGSDGPTILLLEDLVNSQSRLAEEEVATVTAETEHALAHVRYLKATGSLLQDHRSETPTELQPSMPAPTKPMPTLLGGQSHGENQENPPPIVERVWPTRLPLPVGEMIDDRHELPLDASDIERGMKQ